MRKIFWGSIAALEAVGAVMFFTTAVSQPKELALAAIVFGLVTAGTAVMAVAVMLGRLKFCS